MPEPIRFTLTEENAVETDLLIHSNSRDFGSDNAIEKIEIVIDIGKKPIVKNLRSLYEAKGVDLPIVLLIFKIYDIFLLTYPINIIRQGDFKKLKEVQPDVEYISFLENQKPAVTIIDLLP